MTTRDLDVITEISQSLQAEFQSEESEWKGSPFAWIKTRPSRQVGAIGEKLVAGWLAKRGFNVARADTSDADRIVEGKRVEIKFSTLWRNGRYKFQQLRDQEYDLVICLGVSPFVAHCWIIPKEEIIRLWKVERKIKSQHGGQGGADTAWLDVCVESPPEWLRPFGGSLSEAIAHLNRITGRSIKKLNEEPTDKDR